MGQQPAKLIYSVPISEKKEGETQIYKNPNTKGQPLESPQPHIKTIQDLIEHGRKNYSELDFVGSQTKDGKYQYEKYQKVYEEARALGSAIISHKLHNEVQEYKDFRLKVIGIYAKNRKEWNITDMACCLYGVSTVPLYDTLGPESVPHVFQNSSITSVFCSVQQVEKILNVQNLHQLKNLILYDEIDQSLKDKIIEKGLQHFDYQQLLFSAKENILSLPEINPDTIFTFCYTSGTTGLPKGALITHKNYISNLANFTQTQFIFNKDDVLMCYMPLAHVFQRQLNIVSWYTGAKIAFTSGDITKFNNDLQVIRPTAFISVPRVFNRYYQMIQDQLRQQNIFNKKFTDQAISTKLYNLRKYNLFHHAIYDRLIFSKVRAVFGGRVRFCITGSAPLSSQVLDFFKIALSCPFFEGYGQTEAVALEFCNDMNDQESGHVGGPVQNLQFKLVDIPEMNYLSTDKDEQGNPMPRGEICVRGPTVFAGYYKDEKNTKEAIDDYGWLHSGDVGLILGNGALKIIDRRKNIFKLSQGEYVAPEKVENIYSRVRGVAEVFVYGNSEQNYCVGIIVPNVEEIRNIAKEINVQDNDIIDLCANQQMIQYYQKTLFDYGKKEGLATFEQAIKIHLEPVSMLIHGCLTNSLKLQRHLAKQHFKNVIEQLYSRN